MYMHSVFLLACVTPLIFACLIIRQRVSLKLTQETMEHQGLITFYTSGNLLGHLKCSHNKVDKVFAGEISHGNFEMPVTHHASFLFFPNNSLYLLGKLLYLRKLLWGQNEIIWSGKWKHDLLTTFPTQNTKEAQHSSPQSIILIYQTGAALLCTHLNKDVFAFLINLSASIWEAFLYNQWKSVGKPKYLQRLYLMRSFRQLLTVGVTGTGIHLWKKQMQVHAQTYTPSSHTHTPLLSSALQKPCTYTSTH